MELRHMAAETNALPLKRRQKPWCELRVYTNELCCRMMLRRLASLLEIDRCEVKTGKERRKGDQQQQQQQQQYNLT
ncbi:hypothetical protein EYF80_031999 [Liparis tanakae]|uniref:Uncharacterized protein n=1 Tax=Liparis tanakae TaxID=230148 RepID=A0A4Z2GXH9_9TELE|nr:hypothetical protein EYF80_031999 [Liparis tanakae]